ncbi:unnamed protein product, partial [marine sediment metagenome]
RHWILSIFLGLIILGMIGSLFGGDSESDLTGNTVNEEPADENNIISLNLQDQKTSQQNNFQDKLAPLDSEVGPVGTSLTMYRIINRNDYPWHNVEITVNSYYSCWGRDLLEPGEVITIEAVMCNRFSLSNQMVTSLLIETDEGVERYSLR